MRCPSPPLPPGGEEDALGPVDCGASAAAESNRPADGAPLVYSRKPVRLPQAHQRPDQLQSVGLSAGAPRGELRGWRQCR